MILSDPSNLRDPNDLSDQSNFKLSDPSNMIDQSKLSDLNFCDIMILVI